MPKSEMIPLTISADSLRAALDAISGTGNMSAQSLLYLYHW
jgi:hypothetical protein